MASLISPTVASDFTLKLIVIKSVSSVIPLLKSITIFESFSDSGSPLNPIYADELDISFAFAFVKSSTTNVSLPIFTLFSSSFSMLSTVIGSITSLL